MPWVHLVVEVALVEFLFFGFLVGRARGRYGVKAPATSGHEIFDRYFRVQMNTLEQLVVFIPSIFVFARYVSPFLAAGLGGVFVVGRLVYLLAYVSNPSGRTLGFLISAIPNLVLLVGGLYGAARACALT